MTSLSDEKKNKTPLKQLEYFKKYKEKYPERVKETRKKYKEKNREKLNKYSNDYYHSEHGREVIKRWRLENKEILKRKSDERYEANREIIYQKARNQSAQFTDVYATKLLFDRSPISRTAFDPTNPLMYFALNCFKISAIATRIKNKQNIKTNKSIMKVEIIKNNQLSKDLKENASNLKESVALVKKAFKAYDKGKMTAKQFTVYIQANTSITKAVMAKAIIEQAIIKNK